MPPRVVDAVRFMAMKLALLPNLAASLAFSESLTHFLHRGLASRHSQSPKKRRRPHSAHDTHRLLSLSLVYTLTTGSAVPSPPSSASSTRLVHAPAARSLRSARTGGVPTSAIATGSCSRGRPIRGRSIGCVPEGSVTREFRESPGIAVAAEAGSDPLGDASRAKRVGRVAGRAPPRGGAPRGVACASSSRSRGSMLPTVHPENLISSRREDCREDRFCLLQRSANHDVIVVAFFRKRRPVKRRRSLGR